MVEVRNMEIKNNFDFIEEVNKMHFTYAKTYGKTNPHEYVWAGNNPPLLEKVRILNKYIQEHGEKEMFYQTEFDVLYVDGHKYWSMGHWTITKVLNRNWDFKNEDGTINKTETEKHKLGDN